MKFRLIFVKVKLALGGYIALSKVYNEIPAHHPYNDPDLGATLGSTLQLSIGSISILTRYFGATGIAI